MNGFRCTVKVSRDINLRQFDNRNFFRRLLSPSTPPDAFPLIKERMDEGRIKYDPETGELYYAHGAPVGRFIETRDGAWQEDASDYFQPKSERAGDEDVKELAKRLAGVS